MVTEGGAAIFSFLFLSLGGVVVVGRCSRWVLGVGRDVYVRVFVSKSG